jgi:hypothetical protein
LCFLESVGAIFTGWVSKTLVEPKFTFSFIGFEALQPLPGNGMYIYYVIMGIFGLFIMLGYKYRWSMLAFTLLWSATYFMQKSSYNNHYYLLILLSAIMIFQPANRYYSLDVKQNPSIKSISMPRWCSLVFILQLFIVYTYASIAKMYPDWLDTTVADLLMQSKEHYYLVGSLFQEKWMHYFVAYGGLLFDGLIIPLLLFKPTRKWAFFVSIFFHLFNSIVFQVGIFPYLSLAFTLFFFEPKTIQRLFLKKKEYYDKGEIRIPQLKNVALVIFGIYFIIQLALPIRHHFIEDNVLWTEEGHRMSWRMMLRSKNGYATYKIKNHTTGQTEIVKLDAYLTKKQIRHVSTKPDMIWQFTQFLKKEYAAKGEDISVFVDCKISVNGSPLRSLVAPNVDIANTEWEPYKHANWILPSKQD